MSVLLLVIFTNQESGSAAASIFLIYMESLVKFLLITSNKMTRNRKHGDGGLDPVAQMAAETGFFILGFCCSCAELDYPIQKVHQHGSRELTVRTPGSRWGGRATNLEMLLLPGALAGTGQILLNAAGLEILSWKCNDSWEALTFRRTENIE